MFTLMEKEPDCHNCVKGLLCKRDIQADALDSKCSCREINKHRLYVCATFPI